MNPKYYYSQLKYIIVNNKFKLQSHNLFNVIQSSNDEQIYIRKEIIFKNDRPILSKLEYALHLK
jgi:hypothetical protein